jgi:hypothetical protein
MGQLLSPGLTVVLHRRTLSVDDKYTLEDFTSEVLELMKQKFTDGFQSSIRDGVIDGIPSKQLKAQFQKKGITMRDSVLIIEKPPFIWEMQIIAPGEFPDGDATAEKIFNSIKLIP